MCRYIYLHMKLYNSCSGHAWHERKRAEAGPQPTFWSERAGGAVEAGCRGPGIESGPMFRPRAVHSETLRQSRHGRVFASSTGL